ncbi:PTS mannitol transporter subunit IIBC, partial [Clostridioides difficile]|nr:PTS mannitol transporter subunit IIBC [Clostridioides difficile]
SANQSEEDSTSLEEAKAKMSDMKSASKNSEKNIDEKQLEVKEIKKIVFACDAGMGSSAMGASRFKNRIKNLDLNIEITNSSVDNLPDDTQIVVTHNTLVERVAKNNSSVEIVSINNFLNDPNLDTLFKRLESK